MTTPTIVSIEIVRRACSLLLDHLEEVAGREITLEHDSFWAIDTVQSYDVLKTPEAFTIGQLSESVDQIKSIVADPSNIVSYGLVWMSDVMKAVGQAVVR